MLFCCSCCFSFFCVFCCCYLCRVGWCWLGCWCFGSYGVGPDSRFWCTLDCLPRETTGSLLPPDRFLPQPGRTSLHELSYLGKKNLFQCSFVAMILHLVKVSIVPACVAFVAVVTFVLSVWCHLGSWCSLCVAGVGPHSRIWCALDRLPFETTGSFLTTRSFLITTM